MRAVALRALLKRLLFSKQALALSLDRACQHPLDEVALHEKEDGHWKEHRDESSCGQNLPAGAQGK